MPTQLKFVRSKPAENGRDEHYAIIVANKNVGEIRLILDHERPVWIWRIVIADQVVANGAAFTLNAAKSGSKFAWKGYDASSVPLETC